MIDTRKILIFGSTGNVGSYVTLYAKEFFDKENRRLEERGSLVRYEVIASGRRQTDVFDRYGIPYIRVDITKESDFEALPKKDVYAVILLSAKIPSYMKEYNGRDYVESIILGGFNILEYCRKACVDRLLYSQTVYDVAEYPHSHIIMSDDELNFSYTGDHALYVIAKNAMIEMMEHYHLEYGLKKFVFRLPTIYGYSPNHYYLKNGVKRKRPVYEMIERAMAGKPLEIWGDPAYSKDMVHVNDFGQMLCKCILATRDEGVYNVGTGMPVSLEEQVNTIADVFSPEGKEVEIKYCPDKPDGGGFLMDIRNAEEELGYKPKYDCRALFEDFKREMQLQRFASLRASDTE